MDSINNIEQSMVNQWSRTQENRATNELDQDAFLRLFIESLKNQNPLEPMSQGEMMEQLTQLTMIENITKMTGVVENLLQNQGGVNPLVNYFELIGKNVRVQNSEGFFEGRVISVGMQGEEMVFEMDNGESYLIRTIVGVSDLPSVETDNSDGSEKTSIEESTVNPEQ